MAPPASEFTLLSGGARGAEAEFGASAEAWGVGEVNYSFAGRSPERRRGVVDLTEGELAQGEVSLAVLHARLHRAFDETPLFKKMMQTVWHQVHTAGEVFCVGVVQPDGSVKGGTGWAAELARQDDKPLFVFDQDARAWRRWDGAAWVAEAAPVIRARRFCGTGTRDLSDDGRAAIRGLFERTFGPRP